jgi:UDP-3-O-[3-hydroxymyristoyl] glucosamine N-acyltransferase
LEFNLKQIADRVGATVFGDDRVIITGINSLAEACPGQISFFSASKSF